MSRETDRVWMTRVKIAAFTDGDIRNVLSCRNLPDRLRDADCSSAGPAGYYAFFRNLLEPHQLGGLLSV